jgi:hypothetical protein
MGQRVGLSAEGADYSPLKTKAFSNSFDLASRASLFSDEIIGYACAADFAE